MKTLKLYENNAYLRSCEAVVTAVRSEHMSAPDGEQMCIVAFDQTVFFPEGGGQSPDTGKAVLGRENSAAFDVADVQEEDGTVWHVLRPAERSGATVSTRDPGCHGTGKKAAEDGSVTCGGFTIHVGDSITLTIDWDHRFDNMQRHLGEHILSGAFYRLFGAVNKGFHMGEDYITIDLSFDHDAQEKMGLYHFDRVTWEMAEQAELEANRVIWLDAPVTRSHFDTRAEAEKLPLRKALAFDEDISVITVGDLESPFDCVACCGTHPSSAGQVGMIKIYKIEPNKGMSRICLECGRRAFRHYQNRLDDMYDISCELSAGYDDLTEKFAVSQQKTQGLHDRLYSMTQNIARSEAGSIMTCGKSFESRYYDDLSSNDLILIVKQMDRLEKAGADGDFSRPALTILVSSGENTAILVSQTLDCGKLVKENAPAFSGKGGGKPQMARAMFGSADDLGNFIKALGYITS